jgi:replicative DNA helicase
MNSRVPPQNLEAESSVLGGILLENEAINRVLEVITPDDFCRGSHRKIFRAMMELADRKEPVDIITLSEFIKSNGDIEAVGGSSYLASLNDLVPTAVNIAHYARIVKEAADKRSLLAAVKQAEEDLYSSADDSLTIASRLNSSIPRFQNGGPEGFVHISAASVATLKAIERAYEGKSPVIGIPTGLTDLDRKLGGIPSGELWIVAGRPSMGKTALAVTIGKGAAERGYGVAFVSAESPVPKIVLRMIAEASGVESRNLRRGIVMGQDQSEAAGVEA